MKLFLKKILLLLLIIALVDFVWGRICNCLVEHARGGETYKNYYINQLSKEDVLLMGSSRCQHHYDPRIIEDSLHMTCYNCGTDGNGIVLAYPRLINILNHHKPKVIVYELTGGFDFLKQDTYDKYLRFSRPFYDVEGVDSVFWKCDSNERFKMMSNFYRYNTFFIQIIADNITQKKDVLKGYKPCKGTIKTDFSWIENEDDKFECDSLKCYYLEKFINKCQENNIKLVFAISPKYKNHSTKRFQYAFRLAKKYAVNIINHHCDDRFVGDSTLFYDRTHLNKDGAVEYSKVFVGDLRQCL